MAKLYIMQGLPASGKTTRAAEIVAESGNTVRINRDLLRTMLHFDKWSGRNEGLTKDAAGAIADAMLAAGMNVIIDDTNLKPGTVQAWKDFAHKRGAEIQYEKLDTPLPECLVRDAGREKSVGRHVIFAMAMEAGIYTAPEKGIVICDIDGTLADVSHRLHFVNRPEGEKKDWKSFFENLDYDKPRLDVVDMVYGFAAAGCDIFLVSGRPDTYRANTEKWLAKAFYKGKPYQALFMRPAGDSRPDFDVKQGIYDRCFKPYKVVSVIDDRPSVIRMWRANGLDVLDVGDGKEF